MSTRFRMLLMGYENDGNWDLWFTLTVTNYLGALAVAFVNSYSNLSQITNE